jgi:bifunctional ADP-heptose synthase (sugar kinase/adenylyltransferase)
MKQIKILVVGDFIRDRYRICRLKGNLCQEMPLPQLEEVRNYNSDGGAGLVVANLRSLLPSAEIQLCSRGLSLKERIAIEPFNQWLCRIDADQGPLDRDLAWETQLGAWLYSREFDLVIVSDYSKHTIDFRIARMIVDACHAQRTPLFIDARHHWDWYMGADVAFPNEIEYRPGLAQLYAHIVRKSGANGCFVDGVHHPLVTCDRDPQPVDVCGAGDVFLAAFAAAFCTRQSLEDCARYANRAAHVSVQKFGTYVVKPDEVRPSL